MKSQDQMKKYLNPRAHKVELKNFKSLFLINIDLFGVTYLRGTTMGKKVKLFSLGQIGLQYITCGLVFIQMRLSFIYLLLESDLASILLNINSSKNCNYKRFNLEAQWLLHDNFFNIMKDVWSSFVKGSLAYQ